MYGRGSGPPNAKIMVVGEAWGAMEEAKGQPFVGASGEELDKMLHDAGIMRSECFVTNLVNSRPMHNRIESWMPKKKKDITAKHVKFRDRFVDPLRVGDRAHVAQFIEFEQLGPRQRGHEQPRHRMGRAVLAQVAEQLGVSASAVRSAVLVTGGTLRPAGGSARNRAHGDVGPSMQSTHRPTRRLLL